MKKTKLTFCVRACGSRRARGGRSRLCEDERLHHLAAGDAGWQGAGRSERTRALFVHRRQGQ